jgi:hypothetical protein
MTSPARRWRKKVQFAVLAAILIAVSGYADSFAAVTGEKAQTLEKRRHLLKATIPKMESRSQGCSLLTDQFLSENYGAPGEPGRRHCEEVARSRPDEHIRFYRIRAMNLETATVLVDSSAGEKALVDFVFTDGEWLIDSIDILPPREVRLAHGAIGSYRWSVWVHRGSDAGGGRRPCVGTVLGPVAAPGAASATICGSLSPAPILLANSTGSGDAERTILAAAFSRKVVQLRLWLRGRGRRNIELSLIGARQARAAGVARFRFAAIPIAGSYCLTRFQGLDAAGNVLHPSVPKGCSREG